MAAIARAFSSVFLMVMVAIAFSLPITLGEVYNHLLSGEKLKTGENISDINYSLRMQPDCNLVFYEIKKEKAIWNTQTKDKGSGCQFMLRTDGNLVIEDVNRKLVWESKTNGTSGNYVLLIQRDSNIVLYSKPLGTANSKL